MKTYKVETEFVFRGSFFVKAMNKDEAMQTVKEDLGMTMGTITTGIADSSLDWDFDMIPEKKIKSITVKHKSKKLK